MSLVQIKRGIINKDWELVVAGYEAITGEVLQTEDEVEQIVETPKKRRGRPKKVKVEEDEIPVVSKSVQRRLSTENEGRTTKQKRVNLFVDDLTQETKYLQGKRKPPPRLDNDRPKFEKVSVHCAKCGKEKKESVAVVNLSIQGVGKYICSKCIRGGIG